LCPRWLEVFALSACGLDYIPSPPLPPLHRRESRVLPWVPSTGARTMPSPGPPPPAPGPGPKLSPPPLAQGTTPSQPPHCCPNDLPCAAMPPPCRAGGTPMLFFAPRRRFRSAKRKRHWRRGSRIVLGDPALGAYGSGGADSSMSRSAKRRRRARLAPAGYLCHKPSVEWPKCGMLPNWMVDAPLSRSYLLNLLLSL
jgi:hypothetical protein